MYIDSITSQAATQNSHYTNKTAAKTNFDSALQQELLNTTTPQNSTVVAEIMSRYDVKNSTPQQMADLSKELYDNGIINFQQHALLSFQFELSPQYAQLTSKTADLSKGKNYIEIWQNKLNMDQTLNAPKDQIERTQEILNILRNLDAVGK